MIKRLYVNNFRCLENFELRLSKISSLLMVGRNGTGKTTISLALTVLQAIARGANRVNDVLKPSDFAHARTDIPIRIEIEAEIGGKNYRYKLAFELPVGFKEMRVSEESLAVDGKDVYVRDRAQVTLKRTSSDRESKFLFDWHLVALPIIQEQSESDPIFVFKNWLARMLILAPIPSRIEGDSDGDTLLPKRDVSNFSAWFSGLLAHSPAAYSQIDKYLKSVMPDIKDVRNPIVGNDSRSLSVQFQYDNAAVILPFTNLSDGEKCFFICAVVLAAVEAYGPVFCFWDEPDNYLSISEVGHFVMELRRGFQSGSQLMVTSHNPEAIRRFSSENTLLLVRNSHLEPTVIRPLSDINVNGDFVDALIRNDIDL